MREAIRILVKVKLLALGEGGKLRRLEEEFSTPSEISHEGLKRFHEQMLTLAAEAIRKIPVDRREVRGMTLNIAIKDLPAFKRELRHLINKIYLKYESAEGDETYQLNVQFFPLTNLARMETKL